MILDKNGKIGGKISIIDIAVILVILLVAAGIFARYGSRVTKAVQSQEEFRYVLKIESVRQYTVDALNKKGAVTDKRSEKYLGDIVDVQVEGATRESVTADGKVTYAAVPDYYTCYVTIDAHGKESDENYVLDDTTELSVGRIIDFYSKYVKTSGMIMSVEVLSE